MPGLALVCVWGLCVTLVFPTTGGGRAGASGAFSFTSERRNVPQKGQSVDKAHAAFCWALCPSAGAVAGHRPGSDRAPSVARAPCESLSDASASLCRVRLVERGSPHSLPLMESGRVSIAKTRSSV